MVSALDLKFGDPDTRSDPHQLDLFLVVPWSIPLLRLNIANWSTSGQLEGLILLSNLFVLALSSGLLLGKHLRWLSRYSTWMHWRWRCSLTAWTAMQANYSRRWVSLSSNSLWCKADTQNFSGNMSVINLLGTNFTLARCHTILTTRLFVTTPRLEAAALRNVTQRLVISLLILLHKHR